MHGAALRGTARPLWLPNDQRDLTTRVAREERELGRLARAAPLDCACTSCSLVPAAARASTGCEDEHSTCPTSARAPLSHRKRGSGTWHKRRDHWRLRRERCSQLLHTSRWRSRLRRTNAAATLQHFVGVMPDLERGVARAASHSRFTKRKHRCGAQARTASLRGAFARIFGKANVSPSCGCNASLPTKNPSKRPGVYTL